VCHSASIRLHLRRRQLDAVKQKFCGACSSNRRQHLLPSDPVRVGSDYVQPSSSVRDLGISDVSMQTQVTRTATRCFDMLRQLRTIKRSMPADTFQGLVVSLILSRLDYGNATLAGLPANLLSQLLAVMNAGARLIFHANRREHVTPLLCRLHWLRVPERITFKLATLVYQCVNGTALAAYQPT